MSANLLPPPSSMDFDPQVHHRKQTFWQIVFPLALGVLIVLALAVLVILAPSHGGNTSVAYWSHLATVWLILPALLIGLILLILTGGFVYLLNRLLNIVPVYALKAQQAMVWLSRMVRYRADQSVQPVLSVQSWWASVRAFWKTLRNK